jgi:hypothetical protein
MQHTDDLGATAMVDLLGLSPPKMGRYTTGHKVRYALNSAGLFEGVRGYFGTEKVRLFALLLLIPLLLLLPWLLEPLYYYFCYCYLHCHYCGYFCHLPSSSK